MFTTANIHQLTFVQRGLSLIELIVVIMIIGVAMAGIIMSINFSTQHTVDPIIRKQALAIAEALLEEVELMPFTYCEPYDTLVSTATSTAGCNFAEAMGAEGTETRAVSLVTSETVFNNVNDYHGLTLAPFTLLSTSTSGTTLSSLSDFSATVLVSVVPLALTSSLASITYTNGDALLIKVQAGTSLTSVTLEGYRTRYDPNMLMK